MSPSPQEQSNPAHMPTFAEANEAYNGIVEHNRRHTGMGAGMANMIIALAQEAPVIDPESPDQALPTDEDMHEAMSQGVEKAVTEGDMHGELQSMLTEDTFLRIGVKVEPFGSQMVNGEGERTTTTGLVPTIANTELFKEFLGTIKPEEIDLKQDQFLLTAVLANLERTVSTYFDPREREEFSDEEQEALTQHGEDALRTFVSIAPEYKRLGLDAESLRQKYAEKPEGTGHYRLPDDAPQEQKDEKAAHDAYDRGHGLAKTYQTMEDYVTYWGRDVLPEYIVANQGQYLRPPEEQQFGPAQWHTDNFERNWGYAKEFVDGLDQEDRTKEFGQEVRQSLLHSLDVAVAEIDGAPEDKPLYFASQRDDLVNVRNALSGQQYDAERFDQYTEPPNYGS